MGDEKVDDKLGLSLSLSLSLGSGSPYYNGHHLKLQNQKPTQELVATTNHNNNNKTSSSSWNDLFHLSADRTSISDPKPFLGGIDMNSAPHKAAAPVPDEEDDDNGDNSTASSSSGKRSEREEENGAGAGIEFDDDEDGGHRDNMPRKKLRLTKEQSMLLEETFKKHNTLNPKQKQVLAKELNLTSRQVEVWFQNRRARTKLKQTEVDCEYLKRCCENLSEENRRLHKEVQELRALKLSPQLYMHMNPPTTLTMCPSCERVAAASSSGTAHSPQLPSNCSNLLGPNTGRPVPVNLWPFKGSISMP